MFLINQILLAEKNLLGYPFYPFPNLIIALHHCDRVPNILTFCFYFKNFKFYLYTTVYIQYYFVLVSGVQHGDYLTKCPPDIVSTHACCTLHPCDYFVPVITTNLTFSFTYNYLICDSASHQTHMKPKSGTDCTQENTPHLAIIAASTIFFI